MGHTVDDMNSGRRVALYYAAKKHMLSIMDLLLDRGADPNILPAGRKTWEEFISQRQDWGAMVVDYSFSYNTI